MLGSLVIFLFLPVLAAEGDNSIKRELFSGYVTPLCLILSMGSAIVTSIAISIFLNNGTLRVRDVQNGLIAGGVVGGSASYFITSPVYALICGVAGATFQPIFENLLERNFYKRVGLYCTYPPASFWLAIISFCYLHSNLCCKGQQRNNKLYSIYGEANIGWVDLRNLFHICRNWFRNGLSNRLHLQDNSTFRGCVDDQ